VAGGLVRHLNGPQRAQVALLDTDFHHLHVAAACRLFGLEPGRRKSPQVEAKMAVPQGPGPWL
jgi:hypothetical protein